MRETLDPGRIRMVLWTAAGLIAAMGLAAGAVAWREVPPPPAGRPWAGFGRIEAAGRFPDAASEDATSPVLAAFAQALRSASAAQRPIEEATPLVGADGVLVEDLGIETPPGTFLPLLHRGRRAPARHVLTIRAGQTSASEMRLHVLRGSSERSDQDHSIGWFRVSGLPSVPPGEPSALLVFSVKDGAILAAAVEAATGRPLPFDPSQPLSASP